MSLDHSTFINMVQGVVVDPTLGGFIPLFTVSFLNDLIGLFPFAIVLAGQLVFLEGSFTLALAMKLLVFVALPVGLGSAVGSIPLYYLAYFGGKPLINKYKKYLRFSWESVERINGYFSGVWYDEAIFFLLRCVPVLPSIPLDLVAGTMRMPFMPFFVLTAVGSVIRMILTLVVVGMSLHSLLQF